VTRASTRNLSPKHAKTVGGSAKIGAAKAAPKATQKRRKTDAGLNTESESKTCQNCRRQRKNRQATQKRRKNDVGASTNLNPKHAKIVGGSGKIDFRRAASKVTQKRHKSDAGLSTHLSPKVTKVDGGSGKIGARKAEPKVTQK